MLDERQLSKSGSPKRRRPSFWRNLGHYFSEYCDSTSIHGLKFLGERGRSFVEKIWWLAFLTISLYFCVILIMQIYRKWETSPVVVTFATTQTPIWKIPFPSVTICPEIKSKRSSYNFTKNFLRRLKNADSDQKRSMEFGYMSLVCPTLFRIFEDQNATEFTDEAALDFLMEVAPDFEETAFSCKWMGQEIDSDVFKPIITSEGICYSFNLLNGDELFTDMMVRYKNFSFSKQDPSQWSLEKGYHEGAEFDTYPRRTLLDGVNGGLELILITQQENLDSLCGDSLQGYKITIEHPAQLPRADQQYFRVPLDQDVVAAVKPNMMTTSLDLLKYDPEDRQCYFPKEKTLRFFKVYNQHNCLLECLANFTLGFCDCVGFYMPRENSTQICGSASTECMSEANAAFLSKEVTYKLKNVKRKKLRRKSDKRHHNEDCNCLPSCTSLEFDIETSQSNWDWFSAITLLNVTDELQTIHLSRLRIFFKDMQFITSERNELYGQTDFLANCGGLLGLFTGFSFISIVEILYFATLRFICNVRKYGRHYWSGAQELIEIKDRLNGQEVKNNVEARKLSVY